MRVRDHMKKRTRNDSRLVSKMVLSIGRELYTYELKFGVAL